MWLGPAVDCWRRPLTARALGMPARGHSAAVPCGRRAQTGHPPALRSSPLPLVQLAHERAAPEEDAAGARALAAHTAHHQALALEVQQAQQAAAEARGRAAEVEQSWAASQAVSAAVAAVVRLLGGVPGMACLGRRALLHSGAAQRSCPLLCPDPAPRTPASSCPQEATALLGERRALQVSLHASQQEAAALRLELAEARQAAAAARLKADEERRRRETVEQGWDTAKEVSWEGEGAGLCGPHSGCFCHPMPTGCAALPPRRP